MIQAVAFDLDDTLLRSDRSLSPYTIRTLRRAAEDGVHLYYQMDNIHYPIEVQYNTYFDRQLNNWLHKYLYKKDFAAEIGKQLRTRYEAGEIRNEEEFKEVLNHVLCCRETR